MVKIKESRLEIRMNKDEKKTLSLIANRNGMTVTDYIRHRIFYNNPEISEDIFIYESPAKDRHNFITVAVLHDLYWMVYDSLTENKNEAEKVEFKKKFRLAAHESITNYGYLKVRKHE